MPKTLFKTGEICRESGVYVFVHFVKRIPKPPEPTEEERLIPLAKGERFPPIRSANLAAWWELKDPT